MRTEYLTRKPPPAPEAKPAAPPVPPISTDPGLRQLARETAALLRPEVQEGTETYFRGMRAALKLARQHGIDGAEKIVETMAPPAEPEIESRIRTAAPE